MTLPVADSHARVCAAALERTRRRLLIRGIVQGVGLRPFLYRRALAHGLAGFAANDTGGVVAEVEGDAAAVAAFISDVRRAPPDNAVIRDMAVAAVPVRGETGFEIRPSRTAGTAATFVLPDLATCPACLAEVLDPADRRYRYPFTSCTECGPRYSILHALPYDRANTSMQGFPLCPACRAEYDEPAGRRFHAEINACPECGPQLTLLDAGGRTLAGRDDALGGAAGALRRGGIVAVKGLGGFHLLVDARNAAAVQRLRDRKRRQAKPFAVLFPDPAAVRRACFMDGTEAALLGGRERPIVLLRRRPSAALTPGVAPDNPYLGVMLPYTPLHHVLTRDLGFAVVATSGNLSDEPIATDNAEALERLGGIADAFLVHDRPILRPLDDSVAQVVLNRPQILRRARGYAPAPLETGALAPGILAVGGHLKAAVALTREDSVILGQHIGDLDGPLSRDSHAEAADSLVRLYRTTPRAVACDRHPDYHTTRWAEQRAAEHGLPLLRVPHHLAHVAAGMGEHGLAPPVLGVAWDGTGYGSDATAWGGEFILVTRQGWQRSAHLRPFRLPGGEAAVREPRRAAVGLLYELFGEELVEMDHLPPVAACTAAERRTLTVMIERRLNAPVTTSAGRLFDAVSALLGLCQTAAYEGQAACRLEWSAGEGLRRPRYALPPAPAAAGGPLVIDWGPALRAILADRAAGLPASEIAAAFHHGLAEAIAETAVHIDAGRVLLTGGCFQNRLLTEYAVSALEQAGRRAYWHQRVPPGDGGLALGQALWAARQLRGQA